MIYPGVYKKSFNSSGEELSVDYKWNAFYYSNRFLSSESLSK